MLVCIAGAFILCDVVCVNVIVADKRLVCFMAYCSLEGLPMINVLFSLCYVTSAIVV